MEESMKRNDVIRELKTALKRRSGKAWSVTGGRGTAYGWITIDVPPGRRTWTWRLRADATNNRPEDYEEYDSGNPGGHMGPTDRAELARLFGLDGSVHFQGLSIPAGHDFYREYLNRARTGSNGGINAQPYWD